MKIRLSESQYRRLLVEDDKSFLDGMVDFRNIGNKINPYIAKLFVTLYQRGFAQGDNYLKLSEPQLDPTFRLIYDEIKTMDTNLSKGEIILLTHNYNFYSNEISDAYNNSNPRSLIGLPLKFYGKFTHPITIYHSGYVSGYSSGTAEAYATDYDNFIDKFENGEVDTEDNHDMIDYDCGDIHFEPNWDWTSDSLADVEIDDDLIEINID